MKEREALDLRSIQSLPVSRQLLTLALPMIASLFVQGLYSVVDSLYLSRLGEDALSAVSLAFILQGVVTAFATGIATGMNALISRMLGAKRPEEARGAVRCGFVLQLGFAAFFALVGVFGIPGYFALSTDSLQVRQLGADYLRPCMLGAVASIAQVTLERLLQSAGKTRCTLVSQGLGALTNIVLDPLLIFGGLGLPGLGAAGAAYATLAGQAVATAAALHFNRTRNAALFSGWRTGRLSGRTMWEICRVGLPASAVGIAGSAGNYCINKLLIDFSSVSNAAFGVYTKLQSFALIPQTGLHVSLVTLLSYYIGARDPVRLRSTLNWGFFYIAVWSVVCFAAFFFFPGLLLAPFRPTEQMLEVGLPCFRIIGTTYLLSGYGIVMNAMFQASGRGSYSLIGSVARQILIRIPAAIWLAGFGRMELIWWCWPISEVTSDTVTLILYRRTLKKTMPLLEGELNHQ